MDSKHSNLGDDGSTSEEIVSQSDELSTILFYFSVNFPEDILPGPRSYKSHVYNYQREAKTTYRLPHASHTIR
jgi:hypothetical protein